MNWKTILGGLLCFSVGGMTGAYLTSVPEKSPGASVRPVTERRVSSWKRPAASAREKPDLLLDKNDELIEVPVNLLQTLSRSKTTRRIDQPILDDRDPVEAALGLTNSEKDKIRLGWQQACEELKQLEIGALKSADLVDGSVQMKLPDLANARGEVAAGFMKSLTRTLGDDRGGAFYAVKQVGDLFAANSGERSITVKVESVGKERWGYRMTLEDASGKRVWVGDRIPPELRHLADAAGIFPTIAEVVQSMSEK